MLETPEDMGNAVKIRDTIIPAVNIQTDPPEGYAIYFEILFENGCLWICNEDVDGTMVVEILHDWAHRPRVEPDNVHRFNDWDLFLNNYRVMNIPVDLRSVA